MTREEALSHTNGSHTQELSKKELVNKIYDYFEKKLKTQSEHHKKLINTYHNLLEQECNNCKHFKTPQYKHSVCEKIGNITVPEDFGCNKWEQK